jgi:hypothetical protein
MQEYPDTSNNSFGGSLNTYVKGEEDPHPSDAYHSGSIQLFHSLNSWMMRPANPDLGNEHVRQERMHRYVFLLDYLKTKLTVGPLAWVCGTR